MRRLPLVACLAALVLIAGTAPAQTLPNNFVRDILVSSGLNGPHGFTFLPDGGRILIFERAGAVKLYVLSTGSLTTVGTVPNVDISGGTQERGMLSLTPDPDFVNNGYLYAWASRTVSGNMWLMRFTCTGNLNDPNSSSLSFAGSSLRAILNNARDSASNHNGGTCLFGNDGMLYQTIGDDTTPCDAQNSSRMQGVLLRMDVSSLPAGGSSVPPSASALDPGDNPLSANSDFSQLVVANGLRNPFRAVKDEVTGDIFIADVGQNAVEEVSHYPMPAAGVFPLLNFEWPFREGNSPFSSCGSQPGTPTGPIVAVSQSQGWFSIIAGPRYRNLGGQFDFGSTYEGQLFYTDYFSGELRRLEDAGGGNWVNPTSVPGQPSATNWATNMGAITQMAQGPDGAIYATRHSGNYSFSGGQLIRIRPQGPVIDVTPTQGDGQVGRVGATFRDDLEVQVTQGGSPLAGVPVTFTVTSNNGTLTQTMVNTDANGFASTSLTATGPAGGAVTVNAVHSTGQATFNLFARGITATFTSGMLFDILVINLQNTSNGAAPVPFTMAATFPVEPIIPTPIGPLCMNLLTFSNTFVFEDGIGIFGGVSTASGGPFGTPGKSAVYVAAGGSTPVGLTIRLQALWYDPTVAASVQGEIDSNFGLTNCVLLTFM